jgi:hypothetical protein
MNPQLIAGVGGVGGGLILLGIGFVIIDVFMGRLAPRLRQPGIHDLSDQEILISIGKPKDRRRTKWANLNYEAAITHRMRRGGLIVIAVGILLLLGAGAIQLLTR